MKISYLAFLHHLVLKTFNMNLMACGIDFDGVFKNDSELS